MIFVSIASKPLREVDNRDMAEIARALQAENEALRAECRKRRQIGVVDSPWWWLWIIYGERRK